MSGLQYNGRPTSGVLRGVVYDSFELATTTTTDTYTFYAGGLTGKLVATVVITYTDSTKCEIVNVVTTK